MIAVPTLLRITPQFIVVARIQITHTITVSTVYNKRKNINDTFILTSLASYSMEDKK
jgi:hypothetical protein